MGVMTPMVNPTDKPAVEVRSTSWGVPVPERNGDKFNHQLEELALIKSCFWYPFPSSQTHEVCAVEDVRRKTPQSHAQHRGYLQNLINDCSVPVY
jgi:hypothetical protein